MSRSTFLREVTSAQPSNNLPTVSDLLPQNNDENPQYSNDINLPQLGN